jgi:hypothetical protein
MEMPNYEIFNFYNIYNIDIGLLKSACESFILLNMYANPIKCDIHYNDDDNYEKQCYIDGHNLYNNFCIFMNVLKNIPNCIKQLDKINSKYIDDFIDICDYIVDYYYYNKYVLLTSEQIEIINEINNIIITINNKK